jgi:hypothetical protein
MVGNFIFFAINKGQEKLKNKVFLSVLIGAITLGVFGFLGALPQITNSVWWFILLQLVYLGLGIIYYILLQKKTFGDFARPVLSNVILLIATLALGYGGFVFAFNYFNKEGLATYYGLSMLAFVVPFMFMTAFEALASIPKEIHKLWYYPIGKEEPDLDHVDLNNIYLVEIEFEKSPNSNQIKNNKVKAPVDFIFSDWFRSFIDNYNYRFDQDPIAYLNKDGSPHGWLFYTKPSFWKAKRNIDPAISIKANKITEKTIIVAQRVDFE